MIRAISDASGHDAATSLAEIGKRAMGRRRGGASEEDMKTKQRLATLHPEVTNAVGARKED
jgi:hypothetical protein